MKKATVGYFFTHWNNTLMGYAFLSVLILFTMHVIKKSIQVKRQNIPLPLRIGIGLVCAFLMMLFIVLWTMFFTFIYWNARIWVGFGACFVVMMLSMLEEDNRWLCRVMKFASVALTWGCIVFATRVGNLMDIQKRYEDFVFTTLSQDLTQVPKVKQVRFKFQVIRSPIVKKQAQRYPILKDLVSGVQTQYLRAYAYYFDYYRPDLSQCRDLTVQNKKVLLKNAHHKLTQINDACVEIEIY